VQKLIGMTQLRKVFLPHCLYQMPLLKLIKRHRFEIVWQIP